MAFPTSDPNTFVTPQCSVQGCGRVSRDGGYCANHAAVPPDFEWRSPIHVNPDTVDGDAHSLDTRTQRIFADVRDLALEAIRVRDQHRTQIDELRETIEDLHKELATSALNYDKLRDVYEDLSKLAMARSQRDTQRTDVLIDALTRIADAAKDSGRESFDRLTRITTIAREALR